jgi:predicted enzyme related to lactoylglutathione lyase
VFSHIMVGANDIAQSKKFYDAILGTLEVPPGMQDPKGRVFYMTKTGVLGISKPIDGAPASHANGGTIGFACNTAEQVNAWHAAGVANGGTTIEEPPGVRPDSGMYLAYLRDPAGNKLCAMLRPS